MSTDLSPEFEDSKIPITIFKVTKCNKLCSLLKQEVERFWDCRARDKMFRVSSVVKRQAKLLAETCYSRV